MVNENNRKFPIMGARGKWRPFHVYPQIKSWGALREEARKESIPSKKLPANLAPNSALLTKYTRIPRSPPTTPKSASTISKLSAIASSVSMAITTPTAMTTSNGHTTSFKENKSTLKPFSESNKSYYLPVRSYVKRSSQDISVSDMKCLFATPKNEVSRKKSISKAPKIINSLQSTTFDNFRLSSVSSNSTCIPQVTGVTKKVNFRKDCQIYRNNDLDSPVNKLSKKFNPVTQTKNISDEWPSKKDCLIPSKQNKSKKGAASNSTMIRTLEDNFSDNSLIAVGNESKSSKIPYPCDFKTRSRVFESNVGNTKGYSKLNDTFPQFSSISNKNNTSLNPEQVKLKDCGKQSELHRQNSALEVSVRKFPPIKRDSRLRELPPTVILNTSYIITRHDDSTNTTNDKHAKRESNDNAKNKCPGENTPLSKGVITPPSKGVILKIEDSKQFFVSAENQHLQSTPKSKHSHLQVCFCL